MFQCLQRLDRRLSVLDDIAAGDEVECPEPDRLGGKPLRVEAGLPGFKLRVAALRRRDVEFERCG